MTTPTPRWVLAGPLHVPPDVLAVADNVEVLAAALVRRGCATGDQAHAYLDAAAAPAFDPWALPDMGAAVARVRQAIAVGERILVWGDFDVDGQTSTALLVEALGALGADVTCHIPHRLRDGHGVHLPMVQRLIDDHQVQLIITCDTGIDAHKAVNAAAARGVDMVITDHHVLPETLPGAVAVVNPQRLPPEHPLRALPGVGVAYALAHALGAPNIDGALDLVALGIVADVADQHGMVRPLLMRGLDVLRATQRPGLALLMEAANLRPTTLTERQVGFAIAPRLNALGRLDDANKAVPLLLGQDGHALAALVKAVEALNAERRLLSQQVEEAARAQVATNPIRLARDGVLVLKGEGWHPGVLGIVASRLAETYYVPVLLLTPDDDGTLRGSGRSVPGIDLAAALKTCAKDLIRWGGHPMAGGVRLHKRHLEAFRRGLARTVAAQRDASTVPAVPDLPIDAVVPLGALSVRLAEAVERLAPFGPGNPPLHFATHNVRLLEVSEIGRDKEHRQLVIADALGDVARVLWWGGAGAPLPTGTFDIVFTLRASSYRGVAELQAEYIAHRAAAEPLGPATEIVHRVPTLDLSARPLDAALAAAHDAVRGVAALWWAEATALPAPLTPPEATVRRHQLHPAPVLVVVTAPACHMVWEEALRATRPERVVVLGATPDAATHLPFLRRLGGLVKYAIAQQGGAAEADVLAGAMACSDVALRAGLRCLTAAGHISVWHADDAPSALRFALNGRPAPAEAQAEADKRLNAALQEAQAYRAYWRRHLPGLAREGA